MTSLACPCLSLAAPLGFVAAMLSMVAFVAGRRVSPWLVCAHLFIARIPWGGMGGARFPGGGAGTGCSSGAGMGLGCTDVPLVHGVWTCRVEKFTYERAGELTENAL
jgi:hypothetical protein